MWYPVGSLYYFGRSLEDGHALFFLLVAAVIIGVLAWRKPPHWKLMAIVVGVVAVVLAAVSGSRDRRY